MINTAAVPEVSRIQLEPMVNRKFDTAKVETLSYEVTPLQYDRTNPGSGGVYRLYGTARVNDSTLPWSMILKVLQSPAGRIMPNGAVIPADLPDDPTMFAYWKREALLYEAGVLEDLPGDIVAPKCFGVTRNTDDTLLLWQEEVEDASGSSWTLDRYGLAAYHLALFNGAYLADRPIPDFPWLSGNWMRSWLDLPVTSMMHLLCDDDAWQHALVREIPSGHLRERLMRLWTERECLLKVLDALPRVFCHRDAFRSNLMGKGASGGQEKTTAIDWALAGVGPVGEEIAPLIAMRPVCGAERFEPREVDAAVFGCYVRGLHDCGWSGDQSVVRFGYTATAALRYVFPTVTEMLCDARDEYRHGAVEERRGQPVAQVIAQHAAVASFLLDLADEARLLL